MVLVGYTLMQSLFDLVLGFINIKHPSKLNLLFPFLHSCVLFFANVLWRAEIYDLFVELLFVVVADGFYFEVFLLL